METRLDLRSSDALKVVRTPSIVAGRSVDGGVIERNWSLSVAAAEWLSRSLFGTRLNSLQTKQVSHERLLRHGPAKYDLGASARGHDGVEFLGREISNALREYNPSRLIVFRVRVERFIAERLRCVDPLTPWLIVRCTASSLRAAD